MATREPITADEAFDGLPDEIRKAIEGAGWQEKLRRAVSARKLRVDQGAFVEDETLRLMAGLQTVEEYAVHLAQELKLPDTELKALAEEIEREIFVPIQGKIRQFTDEPASDSPAAAASVGQGEEDDLEALLNQDDQVLAKAAAAAPKPIAGAAPAIAPLAAAIPAVPTVPTVSPVSTPAAAPSAATPISAPAFKPVSAPAMSAVAQKLAAPVLKPAENIAANLQRAPEAPKPASGDPYREPVE